MDLFLFTILFLVLLLSLSLFLISLHPTKTKPKTTIIAPKTSHGFKSYPFLGTSLDFFANRHRLLEWATKTLTSLPTNTATMYFLGKFNAVITANPLNVEHILKTNFLNYPKGDIKTTLRDFLGDGIFNTDGDLWKMQRKIASHKFNNRSLRNFVLDSIRSEIQTRLIPLLEHSVKTGKVLDLQDALELFGFDNICKMVFNIDPCCLGLDGSNDLVFIRAFVDASILSTGRLTHGLPFIWNIKRFLNIGSEKRLAESIRIVHNFVENIIQRRLEGKSENYEDILSLFIHAGEKNSLEFLRDMVISFILAGRDTTSSALSWFFWLLSSHPIVIRNIRSEIKTVRARNGKTWEDTFDLDELKELNYLHAALSDSLRLYPPVPIDLKECMKDDLLPDRTVIKKGWFIFYHPFAMGRVASIWGEDYEAFRPKRWLENGIWRPESPFRYPVFQAGPRIFLGKEIAYIQMKFIAASVIQQFDIYPLRKENMPEYIPSLTLRMKNGLPVRVKERNL